MRVAFVGLGIMGHAMATNLVKAGHEVTVWNRTPGNLVEGAGVAPTPGAAAQGAEVVWLCVSDTDAVEGVIAEAPRGEGGFGYDPVFHFEKLGCTYAEISHKQKNEYSHRGRCFRKLLQFVDDPDSVP